MMGEAGAARMPGGQGAERPAGPAAIPPSAERALRRARSAGWAAMRVSLRSHYRLDRLAGTRIRSRIGQYGLIALMLFGIGSFEVAEFFLWDNLYQGLLQLGQPAGVPVMVTIATQVVLVITGGALVISSLFFSRDVARLLPLPLSPGQVMATRLVTLYVDAFLVTAVFVPPVLAAMGVRVGLDPVYWLMALLVWLAMPAIPLAAGAVVAVAIGRWTAVARRKDLLYILGSLFGIGIAMAIQYLNIKYTSQIGSGPEEIARLMQTPNALTLRAARFYPPAQWVAQALVAGAGPGTRAGFGLLFVLVSLALMVPGLALAQAWYLSGVRAGLEAPRPERRRRRVRMTAIGSGTGTLGSARSGLGQVRDARSEEAARLWPKAAAPIWAMAVREWRLIWRNPPFAMTAATNTVVPPVIVAMMAILLQQEGPSGIPIDAIEPEWAAVIVAGVAIFMGGTGQVASTSVSREGRTFELLASLPIDAAVHVRARLLVAAVFAVPATLLLAGASWWVLKPPAWALSVGAALAILGQWPVLAASLWIDLMHPSLRWETPQQAMKGNFNAVWGMLLALAMMAAAAGIGMGLLRLGTGFGATLGAAGVLFAALGAALTRLCVRQARTLLSRAGEAL